MYLTNLIFRLSLVTLTVTKYVDQNLHIILKLLIMQLLFFLIEKRIKKVKRRN